MRTLTDNNIKVTEIDTKLMEKVITLLCKKKANRETEILPVRMTRRRKATRIISTAVSLLLLPDLQLGSQLWRAGHDE